MIRKFHNHKPQTTKWHRGGSVVVDLLLIVTLIDGLCNCSMLFVCYCVSILVL